MDIGLIDVDGHNFPNLPLMKLSAHHKARGDKVDWWNGFELYDIVYKSKVFTNEYTQDDETFINADKIIKGGTGYDLKTVLDNEVEHIYPDYGLYPHFKQAYGFLTRGCPRGCKFCIVGEKEGLRSKQVADLSEFWRGQNEIVLCDPNLLACKDHEKLLQQLIDSKAWVDFNQGLDIRMLTEKSADMINQIKLKMVHFAWDNYEFNTYKQLKKFRPLLHFDERKLRVYVLTNFDTTHEQDLERIYKLRELKYDPFVMIFNKPSAPTQTKRLARWVNNKFIFRSCEKFNDYK